MRIKSLVLSAALFVSVFGAAHTALAHHKWICDSSTSTAWKYADSNINWYNGGQGDYYNIYQEEAKSDPASWHNYTIVDLPNSSSQVTDQIRAWDGYYGTTGWLGLATIVDWSGCTIKVGKSQLNKTYLENGSYTRTNKKHVACQEVGHLLGLDHNRNATDTCMNDNILNAPSPNVHDKDVLQNLYS